MKNILKKFTVIFLIFCLGVCFLFTANAHSGKTDYQGGHHDNINGGYHYHHGYPEHQHINGECPYDMDDQTNHTETATDEEHKYNISEIIGLIICLPFLSYILACIPSALIFLLLLFFFHKSNTNFVYKTFKWCTTILTAIISILWFCYLVFK